MRNSSLAAALFCTLAANAATITGFYSASYDDRGFGGPPSFSLQLTDGTRTLTITTTGGFPVSGSGPNFSPGACSLGSNATGMCTYNPSFSIASAPSHIFTYQGPGGPAGVRGVITLTASGSPVTLQQTNGVASHTALPLTMSITIDVINLANQACLWCGETFTGTAVSSGTLGVQPLGGFDNRRVDFVLNSSPEVPEPTTWMSMGLAGVGLAALRLRRRQP